MMEWTPSTNWICKFVKKNADQIAEKRVRGLDPKHAQAFTKDAVKSHFKKLELFIVGQSIPPENIYNEDEKGIQLGGGRKNLPL